MQVYGHRQTQCTRHIQICAYIRTYSTYTHVSMITPSHRLHPFTSFPPQHPKSTVAANAAKKMNPAFVVVAHENRVGGDTESILEWSCVCCCLVGVSRPCTRLRTYFRDSLYRFKDDVCRVVICDAHLMYVCTYIRTCTPLVAREHHHSNFVGISPHTNLPTCVYTYVTRCWLYT